MSRDDQELPASCVTRTAEQDVLARRVAAAADAYARARDAKHAAARVDGIDDGSWLAAWRAHRRAEAALDAALAACRAAMERT